MNEMAAISVANARIPQTYANRVYFVSDERGLVKIGLSNDVRQRVGSLQSGNAGQLHIMRVIDGGLVTERWLHKRFAAQRIRGEWFDFAPEMMTVCPPDELPVIPQVVVRRDVGLTTREKARDADIAANDLQLSDRQFLLTYVVGLSDEQARELREFIEAA